MFLAIHKTNPLDVMTEVDDLPRLLRRISNHGDTVHSYNVIRIEGMELKRGYTKSCSHFLTHEELRDIGKQYGVNVNEFKPRVRRVRRATSRHTANTDRSGEVAGPSGEGWHVQETGGEAVLMLDGLHNSERASWLQRFKNRRIRNS